MRAPKQMRHWIEVNGFRLRRWKKRSWRDYPMAITRKSRFCQGTREQHRMIRVIPELNRMDICDGDFDRWANSMGASVPMPKTKAEFEAALVQLIDESRSRLRD